MKVKSLMSAAVASGLLTLASAPAHALIVLDGWQLDLNPTFASHTINIGHLNLSGGLGTVNQQVCPIASCGGTSFLGSPFVGAKFSESGFIFTASYIVENAAGPNDFGPSVDLDNKASFGGNLKFTFTDLTGSVTAFDGATGAISFAFDAGVGTIEIGDVTGATTLVDLVVENPSGGSLNNFNGAVGSTGTSTILAKIVSTTTSDTFKDSGGNSLDPMILVGGLFLNAVTTNSINSPFVFTGPCSFDATLVCATGAVLSDGSSDLLTVPEPGTLLLLGIGLAGLGFGARRKQLAA